jgi:hypothetical protein
VEDGLHLVQLLPDAPQRPAFALHGPAGDQVLGDRAEPEQPVEFLGDGEVLAVEDFDVGQVQQIFGDRDGLGGGVTGQRAGDVFGVRVSSSSSTVTAAGPAGLPEMIALVASRCATYARSSQAAPHRNRAGRSAPSSRWSRRLP